MILTGGTGSTGSNFVIGWPARSDESAINPDKPACAGNIGNPQNPDGNQRHIFVPGDIRRAPEAEKVGGAYNIGGRNGEPGIGIAHTARGILDELRPLKPVSGERKWIEKNRAEHAA